VAVPENRKEGVIPELGDAKTATKRSRFEIYVAVEWMVGGLIYPDRQKGCDERKYLWQFKWVRCHFERSREGLWEKERRANDNIPFIVFSVTQ
jgi:hypothetical protein